MRRSVKSLLSTIRSAFTFGRKSHEKMAPVSGIRQPADQRFTSAPPTQKQSCRAFQKLSTCTGFPENNFEPVLANEPQSFIDPRPPPRKFRTSSLHVIPHKSATHWQNVPRKCTGTVYLTTNHNFCRKPRNCIRRIGTIRTIPATVEQYNSSF